MGNQQSSPSFDFDDDEPRPPHRRLVEPSPSPVIPPTTNAPAATLSTSQGNSSSDKKTVNFASPKNETPKVNAGFPGSAFLEKTFCGSIDTTDPAEYEGTTLASRLLKRADALCISSPSSTKDDGTDNENDSASGSGKKKFNPYEYNPYTNGESDDRPGSLLARALVTEVTDNPKTMKPAEMAQREYKLLRAQEAATKQKDKNKMTNDAKQKAVGKPGGVGSPSVLNSFAYACTGDDAGALCGAASSSNRPNSVMSTGIMQGNRAVTIDNTQDDGILDNTMKTANDEYFGANNPFAVTIGLSMSRRHSVGHPETITRQTAYDFNELQDRQYKYVSSTDHFGWRAGGGEKGGPVPMDGNNESGSGEFRDNHKEQNGFGATDARMTPSPTPMEGYKEPSPDTVHIPIIHINCTNEEAVDAVINALASGDIFIPHMSVQPEMLTVNGASPPDLVIRFGCERNDDLPPDEWPNWCIEFMHNQLYEYFDNQGAIWMHRPFSITLARKVRWKTVKHMNRYFSQAERVIESWRQKGPQYLDPQLSYIEGGATPDEVERPHGVYLFRNGGVPTNYFAPNFDPPYTTKMTRSLLQNVLDKSWDQKRREWTSNPMPNIVSPSMLMAVACGCADPNAGGFIAREVTRRNTWDVKDMKSKIAVFESSKVTSTSARARIREPMDVEEKKSDEIVGNRRGRGSSNEDKEHTHSVTASGYAMSVANSGTTVLHTNRVGAEKTHQLYKSAAAVKDQEDSDWLPSHRPKEDSYDPPGDKVAWSKKKKAPNTVAQKSLEDERQQHTELMARAQQTSHSPPKSSRPLGKTGIDQHGYLNSASPTKKSESGLSLDYSTDGSSAFLTVDGTSLLGGQFAPSESYASTTPMHASSQKQSPSRQTDQDDAVEASFSIQESSSSLQSEIPTDEELFVIGWAKAIDQKSGNYYYFTLDRTKTVWENPLASNGTEEEV